MKMTKGKWAALAVIVISVCIIIGIILYRKRKVSVPSSSPSFIPSSTPSFTPSFIPSSTPSFTPSFIPSGSPAFNFLVGAPNTVLTLFEGVYPSAASLLVRSALSDESFQTLAVIPVLSPPLIGSNYAQISPVLNARIVNGVSKVFSFQTSSFVAIDHINPLAGPGTHLNGGSAINIVYTAPDGNQFVFISVSD